MSGSDSTPVAPGGYGNVGGYERELGVVQAIYEAVARLDLEAVLCLVDDDVVFFPTGTASLVERKEPYTGRDGVRRYFEDLTRAWEGLVLEPQDFRAVTGGVVVFGAVEGRVDGETRSGRAMWTWRLRDGKVVSMRVTAVGGFAPPTD